MVMSSKDAEGGLSQRALKGNTFRGCPLQKGSLGTLHTTSPQSSKVIQWFLNIFSHQNLLKKLRGILDKIGNKCTGLLVGHFPQRIQCHVTHYHFFLLIWLPPTGTSAPRSQSIFSLSTVTQIVTDA